MNQSPHCIIDPNDGAKWPAYASCYFSWPHKKADSNAAEANREGKINGILFIPCASRKGIAV